MNRWQGKRYWLVGASAGLGAALARVLSHAGVHVILSARAAARLQAVADGLPGPCDVVPMDVADDASVAKAAKAAGEIDGVVFLAGVYWPFSAAHWDADAATAMADINFTGLVRVMGVVVPRMVERDAGHIVITGSLAGFRGLPGAIGYAASKAGAMALAESMYADLHRTGVKVQLASPGFIRTRLTDKNRFDMPFIMEPDAAARIIFKHMQTDYFARSFPTAFSWVFRLSRFLPNWVYNRIFT
ncbi:MAG: SDR family NAD(P)-dependent oxidoreductase [Rhodobacteraceae bacterium]|nr:SDR family NAD(P)-dependent oxidoreductase [Paracoccaceae bacterium]